MPPPQEHRNPHGLKHADTSTGLVLNALKASYLWGGEAHSWVQRPHVTTNHFDTDSFLSVWCYINRGAALQHEAGACVCPMHVPHGYASLLWGLLGLSPRSNPPQLVSSSICGPPSMFPGPLAAAVLRHCHARFSAFILPCFLLCVHYCAP